jgi:hypothetical protein
MPINVLVASPVRQEPAVLKAFLKALEWQILPPDVQVDYAFVHDGDEEQREILRTIKPVAVLAPGARKSDQVYNIGSDTHNWSVPTFERLALNKQKLIALATEREEQAKFGIQHGYDYVWFVDSDLVCEPTTLKSLLFAQCDIVSGVFWTQWQRGSGTPQPQTWMRHPYGQEGLGQDQHEVLESLSQRSLIRVAGGGACHLCSVAALEAGASYHPRIDGLPDVGMWQGEDRTFALKAEKNHIRQYADSWPDIYHAYHKDQRTPEMLNEMLRVLGAPRQERAKYGDLISLRLTPMEDAALQDGLFPEAANCRGRLGQLKLAPELEQFVRDSKVGSEGIVDIAFPWYHGVPGYAGRTKAIKVEFIDAKPWGYAPVLAEHMFRSLQ